MLLFYRVILAAPWPARLVAPGTWLEPPAGAELVAAPPDIQVFTPECPISRAGSKLT